MSERSRCEKCGGPLPQEGALGGACPRCMLQLGFEFRTGSAEDADNALAALCLAPQTLDMPSRPAFIGRYRILRRIGEGGMGVVYEAEQEQPRRTVALKIIKPGMVNSELLRRFEQETQALARLQHPGIAQIYEAGTADTGFGSQPYFAMEFIQGQTLTDYADERRLNTRQRLEMIAKIAEAIQHAHQRGLIHRDLKPANILVDASGQPKVLDFGVARATDCDARATLQTDAGRLVGTLAYMSPEQLSADPLELDTRSDVYSLGVILYELLAGRLPFITGKQLHETIRTIQEDEAARLSAVDRTYRGDIETIAARALEKDRTRRYASAGELAADIQHYLKDEPIMATPPSTSYQLRKFAQRHKALVAAVAAVFVVLAGGIVASTLQLARANRERDRATAAEKRADLERDNALNAKREAQDAEREATTERNLAVEEHLRADRAATGILNQHLLAVSQTMARESVRLSAGRINDDRAALLAIQAMKFQSLTPEQPRFLVEDALWQAAQPVTWSHDLLQAYEAKTPASYSARFSPDGARLAVAATTVLAGTADESGSVTLWDTRSHAPRILLENSPYSIGVVEFSPDGAHLAVGAHPRGASNIPVTVWDLRNPGAPPVSLQGSQGSVSSLAFSPDGTRLASGGEDGSVRLWNLRNPAIPPVLLQGRRNVPSSPGGPTVTFHQAVEFSPDGTHLVSNDDGDGVRFWDLSRSAVLPVRFQCWTWSISPDWKRLATIGAEGVRLWDLRNPAAPSEPLQGSLENVRMVTFLPDGIHLISRSTDGVRFWDLRAPALAPVLLKNSRADIGKIMVSPDGIHLVSNGTIEMQVWDLRNPAAPSILLENSEAASSLMFSPDGAYLVSGGADGVRMWDMKNLGVRPVQLRGSRSIPESFSPDGSRLVVRDNSGRNGEDLHVWDLRNTGAPLVLSFQESEGPLGYGVSVALSTDDSRLASGGSDKTVRLWNLRSPSAPPVLLHGPQGGIKSVAMSSDGARAASGGEDGTWLWDLRKPTAEAVQLRGPQSAVQSVEFSPDGSRLVSSGYSLADNSVQIWNMRNPVAAPVLLHAISPVMFSIDGLRLASGSSLSDENLRIWDLRNPSAPPVVLPKSAASRPISSVAFAPIGARVASGSPDGSIRLWDLSHPGTQPVLLRGGHAIRSLSFSPDGARLASSGVDGIRLWDLRNIDAPPVVFEGSVDTFSIAFSSDGNRMASGDSNGGVWVRPLWSATADYLCTRVWRNLSMADWILYVGEGIPYERTCPALPEGVGTSAAVR